jgi:epoxide hydrolase-like predicted phosphatase
MIRAIIFDYGNVISRFDHKIFLANVAQFSPLTREEIVDAIRTDPQLIIDYESGRIPSEEFYNRVAKQLHASLTIEQFHDSFVKIFDRIPSTIDIIKQLKPRFKLGLLSNTNEWHFKAEIETLEVFSFFDAVTLSYEVGAMKPSPRIYRDALAKLGVSPQECVYIDDIEQYVHAAKQLGFVGVHYASHDQLIAALCENGIDSELFSTKP